MEDIAQNFLECGICYENFTDPRGLPCLHAYCCGCLKKWAGAKGGSTKISCPTCNKETDIPVEGVEGFPAYFILKNLQEKCQTQKVINNYLYESQAGLYVKGSP